MSPVERSSGGGGSFTSPLTTKGDIYGHSTVDARIPVGSDGQLLEADSTQTLGVKYVGGCVLICDQLLTASQASFDTNTILGGNIPSSFKHLDVFVYGRSDNADTNEAVFWTFNGDSGANYQVAIFTFSGGGTTSSTGGNDTKITAGNIPAATAPASYFSHVRASIANYTDTHGFKSLVAQGGLMRASTAANSFVIFDAGQWNNTAAVTRITLVPQVGNFVAGSRFTLYGLG